MTAKTLIPDAIMAEAKRMYMEYVPVKTIAIQLGVPRTSLQYHVGKYWDIERNLNRAELFRNFADQKKVIMTNMSDSALKIMTRAMEAMSKADDPPTLKEAVLAATILESIDKIVRLDEGTPTDITESRPTTVVELKKRLSMDPFSEVEYTDIEVKQVEENNDDI